MVAPDRASSKRNTAVEQLDRRPGPAHRRFHLDNQLALLPEAAIADIDGALAALADDPLNRDPRPRCEHHHRVLRVDAVEPDNLGVEEAGDLGRVFDVVEGAPRELGDLSHEGLVVVGPEAQRR